MNTARMDRLRVAEGSVAEGLITECRLAARPMPRARISQARTAGVRLVSARIVGNCLVVAAFLTAVMPSSRQAAAAEITDVADAADTLRIGNFERDDLWDIHLDDSFEMVMENGKITREPINMPGRTTGCSETAARDCRPVDELQYKRNTSVYHLRAEIGVFQDVALTVGWSYVVSQSMRFDYAPNVDASNSTVDSTDYGTLFPHDFRSDRKGSGAFELGFRFAPLSDERDESKPTWVLAFNWAAPWTSQTKQLDRPTAKNKPGRVGDGINYLTFSTALSKRLGNFGLIGIDPNANRRGYLDPYIELAAVLPLPQRGKALPALLSDKAVQFAKKPSRQVKLNAGFEVVPFEDLKEDRRLAIDFGLRSTLYTEGRNYSELSDALGRLTYTDQYVYVGGLIGVYAQLARVLRLKVGVTLGYNTPHFLTDEEVGIDVDRDGSVITDDPNSTDAPSSADIANPYYCGAPEVASCANNTFPYDQVGERFKDQDHVVFGAFASLMLTF
jgi:hypothetical protein